MPFQCALSGAAAAASLRCHHHPSPRWCRRRRRQACRDRRNERSVQPTNRMLHIGTPALRYYYGAVYDDLRGPWLRCRFIVLASCRLTETRGDLENGGGLAACLMECVPMCRIYIINGLGLAPLMLLPLLYYRLLSWVTFMRCWIDGGWWKQWSQLRERVCFLYVLLPCCNGSQCMEVCVFVQNAKWDV